MCAQRMVPKKQLQAEAEPGSASVAAVVEPEQVMSEDLNDYLGLAGLTEQTPKQTEIQPLTKSPEVPKVRTKRGLPFQIWRNPSDCFWFRVHSTAASSLNSEWIKLDETF